MIYLTEWVHRTVGLSLQLQTKLLQSLLAILFLWVLHRLVMRIQTRRNDDPSVLYRWRKTSSYIASHFRPPESGYLPHPLNDPFLSLLLQPPRTAIGEVAVRDRHHGTPQ